MWKDLLAGIGMGMVLPGMLLNFGVMLLNRPLPEVQMAMVVTEAAEETAGVSETEMDHEPIQIGMRSPAGDVQNLDLEEYLVGVVLAEMPAWFEEEALKAQAVVARTYTLKALTTGGKHADGSICGQSNCCQAYIREADYMDGGGNRQNIDKIRAAVEETEGMVLVYGGELIDATYFSCSGGRTEDAQAVWGTAYPYLQAVNSPGEENASHYRDTEFFAAEEFCNALGIQPEGTPDSWLGSVEYTAGDGIASMEIGGTVYSGVELRQRLGLRSTAISMEARENGILVTTRGFGHRVGMSQYGADAMAVGGSRYPEILAHYYTGTSLEKWTDESK